MMIRTLFGAGLILALASCAPGGTGGVVATNTTVYPLYTPALYQWVAAGRDVPVEIIGRPSTVPPDVWDTAVTDAMNASAWVTAGNFTTTPDETARGNFDFVLVFGATSTMWAKPACAGNIDVEALGPVDGRLAILGAFCNNDRTITTSRVTVNEFTTADSPVLHAAIDQLLTRMLPKREPDRTDRRGGPIIF